MVLLDMAARGKLASVQGEYIVAHFDHGIRPDSADDARFVAALAASYDLPYETRREVLGAQASEAMARTRRYKFLRDCAARHKAQLVTAHHLDDMIETIAINLARGTGWRGLAVFGSDILRPLQQQRKADLYEYASQHQLEWVEDETNATDAYLRNRIRRRVAGLAFSDRQQLTDLQARQRVLRQEIDEEVTRYVREAHEYERALFIQVPHQVGMEFVRALSNGQLTRPQLQQLLLAIKTMRPGATYQAGAGIELSFNRRFFTVKVVK